MQWFHKPEGLGEKSSHQFKIKIQSVPNKSFFTLPSGLFHVLLSWKRRQNPYAYLLWQNMYSYCIFARICPELYLCQDLVGKGIAHDKAGMTHGTPQVYQSTFCQDYDVAAIFQFVAVHLNGSKNKPNENGGDTYLVDRLPAKNNVVQCLVCWTGIVLYHL